MDLSVWDPRISSKFWVVTSSTIVWRIEIGVETFNAMYFDKCSWVTENIGDHLDYLYMEYECGILAVQLHSYDKEYQMRVVQRQNKWMVLSSPYFVCNILMKALYNLSPNNDFEWNMTLQPDSYSSLVLFFVSTYILVVWGEQVYGHRQKHLGVFEYFICFLDPLLALNFVNLDVSTGYISCKQLEKCEFGPKLIFTNASVDARRYDYARLYKVCSKQEVSSLEDMSHVNGLVASLVMFSPFEYSTVVTFATHFMGAKAYITDVFGNIFFALEGFGYKQTIFYIVSRLVVVARSIKDHISIQDHILYYTDIA
ncbi:hypothetical protein H5410_014401 [Solanum commersonii]|uniref:Serine hydroxymethyltransferase-like domain-containing protein n=1 Tax=Solanum commersonii TaxID=4109 RepID=A0A9J5ZQV1_SOLCO|nr:hypothetical protein H5410_014401 [Solanum commersonii]